MVPSDIPTPPAQLLRLTLDNLPDGILVVSGTRRVVYSNQRFREMWRIPPGLGDHDDAGLLEHVLDQLADPDGFVQLVERLYASQTSFEDEVRFRDGRVFARRTVPFVDEDQSDARIWIFTDITPLRAAERDALTGVQTRARFDAEFAARTGGTASSALHALIVLDVDHFKAYNDRYGHAAGDEALRQVGAVLRDHTRRRTDEAYRYGGEEFALLCSGRCKAALARHAQNVLDAVAALGIEHPDNVPHGRLTVSAGIGCFTGPCDAAALFERVDAALYAAKDGGRNCLRIGPTA